MQETQHDNSRSQRVAILCGGGPAPGINSVIGAATIRAIVSGFHVVGIRDGFKWLMQDNTDHAVNLSIEDVSRIHFTGGSFLGISRANPTRDPRHLEAVVHSLGQLGVDKLITIGGDDTAFSAMQVAAHAQGRLRVVHVPKTIDNDLDLPHGIPTFGFQTARHVGVDLVKNLMVDARTTGRWYLIVAMGRKAGHLALGIGKAAGATLTIIPEEFAGSRVRLDHVIDVLLGAIIKRKSLGHDDGTAVLAEGLAEHLHPDDFAAFGELERDEHDHVRLGEVNLGEVIKMRLRQQLAQLGMTTGVVSKDIGYELRCADPIPYDMEYTRDLGYCAAQYLLDGGTDAMVMMVDGRFVPQPFGEMLDASTGRTRVRLVDVTSEQYEIARHYMVRLRHEDFNEPDTLAALARVIKVTPEQFRGRFGYLVGTEPPAEMKLEVQL
ncbi:MAG TPA: diphosphate--fructose-6-phosphate 1-phosphotransferase [Chloroflexota bacterium]|jgi:6-phosphofructokinase 1